MKKLVLVSVALVLAACNSGDSGTITTEDGEKVTYDIDSSGSDAGGMTIKSEDGELNVRAGPGTEVDLPDGFSVYPGAQVAANTTISHAEADSTSVMMVVPGASPDEVVAFYRRQAEAAGVDINTEMKMDTSRIIGGRTEGGLNFSLNVSPGEDGGSAANLSLVQKKGG